MFERIKSIFQSGGGPAAPQQNEIEEIVRRIDLYRAELEFPKIEVSGLSTPEGRERLNAIVQEAIREMPGEMLSSDKLSGLKDVVEKARREIPPIQVESSAFSPEQMKEVARVAQEIAAEVLGRIGGKSTSEPAKT